MLFINFGLTASYALENEAFYTLSSLGNYLDSLQQSSSPASCDDDDIMSMIRYNRRQFGAVFKGADFNPRLEDLKGEKRFQYLQVIAFLCHAHMVAREMGLSFWSAFSSPRYVYHDLYQKLWKELLDSPITTPDVVTSDCRYPDSVHNIFDMISLMAHTLVNCYGNFEPILSQADVPGASIDPDQLEIANMCKDQLQTNVKAFIDALPHPQQDTHSYWSAVIDRIGFLANHIWEYECLHALEAVQEIVNVKPAAASSASSKSFDYSVMLNPSASKITQNDRVSLLFLHSTDSKNGTTINFGEQTLSGDDYLHHYDTLKSHSKILNDFWDRQELSPDGPDECWTMLDQYIETHRYNLAEKVFCLDRAEEKHAKRISRRKYQIHQYLAAEHRRYGNSGFLSKSKLIAIYQAYFLLTPKSGLVKAKHGIRSGSRREKSTFSSSLSVSQDKDPYFLHMITIMVDYLTLLNEAGKEYASYFLQIPIAALTSFSTQPAWGQTAQECAELILSKAVNHLFTTEDGLMEYQNFISSLLCASSRSPGVYPQSSTSNLSRACFGKWLRLLNTDALISLIDCTFPNGIPYNAYFSVLLDSLCEHALLLHPVRLTLKSAHDLTIDFSVPYLP